MSEKQKILRLIRSRFQPFTTFHAELILQIAKQGDPIGLVVIRDYETISRWHRMSPKISTADLRHLSIFNPYTSWEVYMHIKFCLQGMPILKNINLQIIVMPLKFSELLDIVRSKDGKVVPEDIQKFTALRSCPDEYFKQCSIPGTLGKLISIISFDSMPRSGNFCWAFGILDYEDFLDFKMAKKVGTRAKIETFMTEPPLYKFEAFDLELGLYGQFMLWIYLQFLEDYENARKAHKWRSKWPIENCPDELLKNGVLSNTIKKLESHIKGYVWADVFQNYKKRVKEEIAKLLEGFAILPEPERDVLLNCSDFRALAEDSIKFYKR